MRKLQLVLLLVCGLLISALPTLAHHSFAAEFDGHKLITYTGTLTKLDWGNPHGFFYLNVTDEHGNVSKWAFEIASPNILRRSDEATRTYFIENMGKTIITTACPAKNGELRAATQYVKFADGRIAPMGPKTYQGDLDSQQILRDLK
jgi:Family of unknown function (DUF6152)